MAFDTIAYIYTYHLFGWEPTQYAMISTIFSSASLVFSILCVPLLTKVPQISDPILTFLGTLSMMAKNICLALSSQPWIYYLGNSLGMLNGVIPLSIRSQMSKLVNKDDLGKVFSFLSTCESLVPLAGTAAVTKIFNATIGCFPGTCYLLAAVLLLFPLATSLWLARLKLNDREDVQTAPIINEDAVSINEC